MSTYIPRSEFLRQSLARGFIHQSTNMEALDQTFLQGPVTGYIGFDATADSLHVGSLVQIMWLRLLQKTGNRPLVLMGDATTIVGDPTGKDTARPVLSELQIQENVTGISKVFRRYLDFETGQKTDGLFLKNSDWLSQINYLDFLRKFGSSFSINRMLTFESVKLRLEREQPLSFLEFNYMVLQAYDFMQLCREHQCHLQMGGADQWGNIVNGVELSRKKLNKTVFGLTSPLITTAAGQKMGKTAQGAIWLNEEKRSSFDFWQFWRNVQDADVGRFLRLFTELPLDEIERLEALKGAELNAAKKILADEVTALARGRDVVEEVRGMAMGLFEREGNATSLEGLPTLDISAAQLEEGISLIEVFEQLNMVKSKGEARRLIRGGGARVNDTPVRDELYQVSSKDLQAGQERIKISAGKKHHGCLKQV